MSENDPSPTLDYARDTPQQKLVRLGPFGDLIEAGMFRAKMEDHGILVEIAGENQAAALGPIYGRAYGGVHLLVREIDEEAALKIIADVEARRRERLARENPPCPKCRRYNVRRRIPKVRLVGIAVLLSVVVALSIHDSYVIMTGVVLMAIGLYLVAHTRLPLWWCADCGNGYEAEVPDTLED